MVSFCEIHTASGRRVGTIFQDIQGHQQALTVLADLIFALHSVHSLLIVPALSLECNFMPYLNYVVNVHGQKDQMAGAPLL